MFSIKILEPLGGNDNGFAEVILAPLQLGREFVDCMSESTVNLTSSTRIQKPLARTHFLPFSQCQALSFLPDSLVSSQPPGVRSAWEKDSVYLHLPRYQQSANRAGENGSVLITLACRSSTWAVNYVVLKTQKG